MNNYLLIYMRPKTRNFIAQFERDKVPTHSKSTVILQNLMFIGPCIIAIVDE